MISNQELQGKWHEIRGRIKERWGQITDEDLQEVHGEAEQLVGVIQSKTGEARNRIEDFIEELSSGSSGMLDRASQTAAEYKQVAQEGLNQAADNVRAGYAEAEGMVRRRPMESLAVTFGVGLIAGVIIGVTTRSR